MYAIISDVHANIEAFTSVMEDIEAQKIGDIVCLGDVVGYGPDPRACLELVMKHCRFCLSGNHDHAVLSRAVGFNPLAEEAVNAHRRLLRPGPFSLPGKKARWAFLEQADALIKKQEQDSLFVHGSPRDERNEYILESDITFGNVEKIQECFEMIPRLCFIGHTHCPGIIDQALRFLTPEELDYDVELSAAEKFIINVGSVGQPRDGDNRSCYVIVDGSHIRYRRVEYDFKNTMSKLGRIGDISREAADRLEHGR